MSQQPGAEPQYSPDGKWWWNGYQWVPVPLTPPRLVHKTVGFRLAVVSVLVLLAGCGTLAFIASHGSGTPSAAVTGLDPEKPNVTSAPTEAATPAGITNDQAVAAVLAYRACPGKQGDTLRTAVAYVFTIANDDPTGTDVVGRQGDIVRVAVHYTERGAATAMTFDYHVSTGQVTGEDKVAVDTLGALQAECP